MTLYQLVFIILSFIFITEIIIDSIRIYKHNKQNPENKLWYLYDISIFSQFWLGLVLLTIIMLLIYLITIIPWCNKII